MTSRIKRRIDYKALNSTGERKFIPSSTPEPSINIDDISNRFRDISLHNNMSDELPKQLEIDIKVLSEDITDLMDECPIMSNESDVQLTATKLTQLRSELRRKYNELEAATDGNIDNNITTAKEYLLSTIKDYIKSSNDVKSKSKLHQSQLESAELLRKDRSIVFIVNETNYGITELETIQARKIPKAKNHELLIWRDKLSHYETLFDKVSKQIHQLLTTSVHREDIMHDIEDLAKRYDLVSSSKQYYISKLEKEIDFRELDKLKTFNASNLNIRLDRFSGYDSPIDIYTFKSEFEKVHLQNTPHHLLPDLLLNNFLAEPALSVVKGVTDIDIIWERLIHTYGDTKTLLFKKLDAILRADSSLSRSKDPEKVATFLSRVSNGIKDLMNLAEQHDIEDRLFYGDGLERIYNLLGDGRVTRWLDVKCSLDSHLSEKQIWNKLLLFLEKEINVQREKLLIVHKPEKSMTSERERRRPQSKSYYADITTVKCFFCDGDESDHTTTTGPAGSKIIQYFSCKEFVDRTPADRLSVLRSKGLCIQCLYPGASANYGKHKEGKCQRDFVCQHFSHNRFTTKKHVLLCEDHKESHENRELLEKYKSKCVSRNANLKEFSKNIKICFLNNSFACRHNQQQEASSSNATHNEGIYLLQTIKVNGNCFNVFYDNGCADFIVKCKAIQSMGRYATQEYAGPVNIGGIGETQTTSNHGIYNVKLQLYDGRIASFSGTCLDKIASTFPTYPLRDVEADIHESFKSSGDGGDVRLLPRLPMSVGGDVDLMIGIKYLRYHPRLIYQLPSGLALYESFFENADGGRGVVGGPHPIFTKIQYQFYNNAEQQSFLATQRSLFKFGYNINPDVSLLAFKDQIDMIAPPSIDGGVDSTLEDKPCVQSSADDSTNIYESSAFITRKLKVFNEAEVIGSNITYRCITCRQCKTCKNHDQGEATSIREEVEQNLINSSVSVDTTTKVITATLPFIHDPHMKLAPNKDKAMRVFHQQLRKLNQPSNTTDKQDIIESEAKLQQLGHVDYLRNLPVHIQDQLKNQIHYYIPWRAVWKPNSASTPCRVVFDASQPTSSGFSLNDILAKGQNNLNKLQEILIRWTTHSIAISTDIKKMYNTIKLHESNWCFQRYIWEKDLDPKKIPEEKIIKTLIYGVRPSGNQAECGLRRIAELSNHQYPKACKIIKDDVYVDDCLTGDISKENAILLAEQLETVINKGGFQLKGIAFSGEDPPPSLSKDGVTLGVAGMLWYPKDDMISLDISELNFSKKQRGKKPTSAANIIPTNFTRRHCASKVAEIFDLIGKVTPITASMKLDLHELVIRKLDWDDPVPNDLREIWLSHFKTMTDIRNLKFKRAIVPEDACNLNINTLDFADASQMLACVAIYARFRRTNGKYSCQLVFSRSKMIPKGTSQPRAELHAALMNAHTGDIVRRSFGDLHKSSIKLTDSQIALHWLTNDQKPLKQWVRNRVIDALRFTNPSQWYYVKTENMIADVGTRRGATLSDIDNNSAWINGYDWMKEETLPIYSPSQLTISTEVTKEVQKESIPETVSFIVESTAYVGEVAKRYEYSNYLVDPNQHRFGTVVRILAFVIRFCNKVRLRLKRNEDTSSTEPSKHMQVIEVKAITPIKLSTDEIASATLYFFKKSAAEVKKFLPVKAYENITTERNGILWYTARILNVDDITIVGRFNSIMKDLSQSTFCVPVVEKFSPVALAIVNDVHWYHISAKHSGVETTLRYVSQTAHIIEGRYLAKKVRKECHRCRYIAKRTIEVSMGPVSPHTLTVAPAFYITQVDLCGPFLSFSPHHKRTTVKIWFVVFCCSTTSTTSIKVMEDYSTTSFLQSFTRFSCDVGYPKRLLCDEGGQLVKGCQDMRLQFKDIQHQLQSNVKVEFELCPVGGHNVHGRVERKIREVKSSMDKTLSNQRLSLLQWETLAAVIANSLNDMPLALGSICSDLENLDLLTPNRLKLGRNNDRSPVGQVEVVNSPSKIIKENEKIFTAWFENWLLSHVPKLLRQEKWFRDSKPAQIGDVVLFLKNVSVLSNDYQYGMVVGVEVGSDGGIRVLTVRYKNFVENVFRETRRSARSVVIIHHVDDIDLSKELYEHYQNSKL